MTSNHPYVGAPDARPSTPPIDDDVVLVKLDLRIPDRPTLDAQESIVAILRKLADRVESGAIWDDPETTSVLDGLGNVVGSVDLDVEYADEVGR